MQYTAPTPTNLSPGKDFSADVIEGTLSDLRSALNGTVGCYRHPGGRNIVNDNQSIVADTLQPGACVEVYRTDPFIVGPQSFVATDSQSTDRVAFADYASDGYPAGASVSFVAGASGKAFVTTSCSLEKSSSAHMISQTGYKFHETRIVSSLYVSVDGAAPVVIGSATSSRMWRMDGDTAASAPGDSHQVTSPNCFAVYDVSAGSQYSFFMRLLLTTTFSDQDLTPGFHGNPSSTTTFIQLVGNGSSATAFLVTA
tara:strand:+ start:20889 stop:21653 length:765 start_codon:yes stop_codon:yes gene_type:complete